MIHRQAFFEGNILAGKEDAFRKFVVQRLIPLWRTFPGANEVRVLFAVERDDGAPSFPLSLFMTFDDRSTLENALGSPVRYESREVTKELMTMFDGHIHHHVFEIV